MSSLIATKIKTNSVLFRLNFYCSHYSWATIQTYTTYTTIIITITIRSLSAYNLFVSHTCTLFCIQLRYMNMQLFCSLATSHKSVWILSDLSYYFIVQQDQSNEHSWNKIFLFSSSRELYCNRLYMCIPKHVFPSCCC